MRERVKVFRLRSRGTVTARFKRSVSPCQAMGGEGERGGVLWEREVCVDTKVLNNIHRTQCLALTLALTESIPLAIIPAMLLTCTITIALPYT